MESDQIEIEMPEIDWAFDQIEDMNDRLAILEAKGKTCVPVRYKGDVAWLILGYDAVERVYRDSELAYGFNHVYMDQVGFSPFTLRGAEHKAYKTALLKMMSRSVALRLSDVHFVPMADRLIDDFGDRREVDFTNDFAKRYGFKLMTELIGLDLAQDEEEGVRALVSETSQIQDSHASWEDLRERTRKAGAALNEVLRPLMKKRQQEPGDDLMTAIINLEVDGRRLNDEEILDMTRAVYDGSASTGYQLPNLMNAILRDPAIMSFMLENPLERSDAVAELMRLEPIIGLIFRRTMAETQIGNTLVPAGSILLLTTPGANRSAAHFNNPNQFSLEKRSRPSLTFGAGVRNCPGQHLARQEINVAIDRLLDRLPGLRLSRGPGTIGGSLGRALQQPLFLAFDEILPG